MLRNLSEHNEEKPKEDIFQSLETHLVDLVEEDKKQKNEENFKKEMKTREEKKSHSPGKFKTSANLSWLKSVQKVSTSIANSRLFVKGDGEILFCVSVDGSIHSDFSFDLVTENYMFPYTKLLCIHVFNSKIDSILNYSNKKTTILEKYANKIEKFKKQSHFVTEDRMSKTHALEQAARLAESYLANYLVCGWQGMKGPRGDNKEQIIGHEYLLSSSKTPVMIVREETLRSKKEGEKLKWLVVLDKQFTYTNRCFTTFTPLIDPEKDIVHGLGFYPYSTIGTDTLEEQFLGTVKKFGIKNFEYEALSYGGKKLLFNYVIEKLNFGNVNYDFVLIYNNSGKFKSEPEQNDASNIIKGTTTNVCFVNN